MIGYELLPPPSTYWLIFDKECCRNSVSKGRPEVSGITQGTEKLRSDLAHRLTKFSKMAR